MSPPSTRLSGGLHLGPETSKIENDDIGVRIIQYYSRGVLVSSRGQNHTKLA